MDEHLDDEHLSRLAEETTKEVDTLRDARRRYKVPDGIIPGTLEYKKWQVEHQKLRNKLYQKRAYLRRRKLALALQKYTEGEQTTVEEAIAVVDDELNQLREVRSKDLIPARATPKTKKEESTLPQYEFVEEMAKKHNISYDEAYRIMFADDYNGDESFEAVQAKKLEEILGKPLTEVENEPNTNNDSSLQENTGGGEKLE